MKNLLQSHFLWKLYAGYTVIILLATLIVGVLTTREIEKDTLAQIKDSLEMRAIFLLELVPEYIENGPNASFQERIKALGSETGTRLTVIRADGVVIADSSNNPLKMDNHEDRPEVFAARSQGVGISTRFSNTLGMNMQYLALPIRKDGRILGYVRTSLPLSVIGSRLHHLRSAVVLGVGFSAMAALFLGVLLARHTINPLTSMIAVAESMAKGNYDQRLPVARQDQIGKLAQALNRMADSCQNRMETITTDRNKLSTILMGMIEGVVAVDHDENVVHMNEAAGKLLGVSLEDVINKPIWQVTRIREICEILNTTLHQGISVQQELRLVVPSQEQLIEMHTSPLHDGQGHIVGAVVVLHDISELERLETVRRDFVANASHELKTPIAAIRGLVETLIDDTELPMPMRERFLGKIKKQTMRLSLLVTDLLALSRFESKDGNADTVTFDLHDVVGVVVKALVPVGESQGITVTIEEPDTPLEIVGDEDAISQVVSNLLDNAFKYTHRGGQVWVRTQRQGNDAVIEVQDTGIGIAVTDQDRIFERFYRVDKARSRELGGTGLGLSIVKHIALEHKGRVTVSSVCGKGSTFRVFLPLALDMLS